MCNEIAAWSTGVDYGGEKIGNLIKLLNSLSTTLYTLSLYQSCRVRHLAAA